MSKTKKPVIKVCDIMKAPVVTIDENESISCVAKLMVEKNVGSVVVVDVSKKPVGIITAADIVKRVVAKNVLPSKVKSKDVMSKPVVTIFPQATVNEAITRMRNFGVKRLVVMDKGEVVGIVSSLEILNIKPKLLEVSLEKIRLGVLPTRVEGAPLTGYCESCGQWSETLFESNGKLVCEECISEEEV
ncbi:MAG: CBS domain-containing protein [Candidatus Bathyarchaeota archaeon]|nr:CBS domain-containing protein [Candidatus Bathyarchaeota archaeon]